MLQCCTLNNALIFKTCWWVAWSTDAEKKKKNSVWTEMSKDMQNTFNRQVYLNNDFLHLKLKCRQKGETFIYRWWQEEVTLNICQKNHSRRGRTECKLSYAVWLISLKMTSGVCSLSQLHIYQMSVDVRGKENNSGPLTRSLHPQLSSDTVSLLRFAPCGSWDWALRSLWGLWWLQALTRPQPFPLDDKLLYFSTSNTRIDGSPQTNNKKPRGEILALISSMAVSMGMHRETSVQFHILNPKLTLSSSVRGSGTCQLPVSGNKRDCADMVQIRFFCLLPCAKFIKFAWLNPIRKCALPPVER